MPNIHGLFSKKDEGRRESGEDESDSDEEGDQHRQGFYVGGGERSGQEVLGPRGDRGDDPATRLFNAARMAGAEQISPEEAEASARAGPAPHFQGTAYRLGGHGLETQTVGPSREEQEEQERQRPLAVNFNVWNNGFSVDDGPLREMNDPANRPFLQAISQGRIPPELVQLHPDRKIDFHMHRRGVDYVPPKPKPFSGQGHRLGAVAPNVIGIDGAPGSSSTRDDLPKPPTGEESKQLISEAQAQLNVQADQPQTRIQIRIGTTPPFVGTFNHDHHVADLRNFIVGARPDVAFRPFQLMTVYPAAVIENEEATLKEANILSSAITVKFES